MKRVLPRLRLTNSPLVLVLCQVRITTIRNMADYIPQLQDRLRKENFPVDVGGEVVEVAWQAGGSARQRRRAHWEFRTLEEDWSIIVAEGAVVVQTSSYSNFEEFLRVLSLAMQAVDAVVGSLVVERIGLRYVDAINPRPDESWKAYVKPGYHGQENDIIRSDNSVLFMQTIADTGPNQRMIIRLSQNRESQLLPADLVPHQPKLLASAGVEQGALVTLLDFDHYRESRQRFETGRVVDIASQLHEGIEVMFQDLVTPHALTVWG